MKKITPPADWGSKKRKVQIEISEQPNDSIGFETFIVLETGERVSGTVATVDQINEVLPLVEVVEKLLEPIPAEKVD